MLVKVKSLKTYIEYTQILENHFTHSLWNYKIFALLTFSKNNMGKCLKNYEAFCFIVKRTTLLLFLVSQHTFWFLYSNANGSVGVDVYRHFFLYLMFWTTISLIFILSGGRYRTSYKNFVTVCQLFVSMEMLWNCNYWYTVTTK